MFVIDRNSFIVWTQGILLTRNASGHVVVGDNVVHEQTMEILESGEKVYLSVNNKVVSYIRLAEDGYQEFIFEEIN
jgi:hypothetical protein